MPVAFSQEVITQQWDAAKLRTTITNKLLSIGWVQEYVSGNDLFFSYDAPTSAPKDKVYAQITVSQPTGTQIKVITQYGDGYSAGALQNISPGYTDSVGGSQTIGYSSNESFPLKFLTFSSSEIKWLLFYRSDSTYYQGNIGVIMPAIKPNWWDNNSVYAFHPSDVNVSDLRTPLINLVGNNYSTVSYTLGNRISALNPGGTRDLIKRLLLSGGSGGNVILGLTSTDLGQTYTANLAPGTQFVLNGETWVNIYAGGNSGLCVRIA